MIRVGSTNNLIKALRQFMLHHSLVNLLNFLYINHRAAVIDGIMDATQIIPCVKTTTFNR
jgi:hypothetical protein